MKYALFALPLCAALIAAGLAQADDDSRLRSVKFYGIVDMLPQNSIFGTWLVNGRQVAVTRNTEIEQGRARLAPGVYVQVEGHYSGSMFVAEEIEVKRSNRRS